MKCNYCGEVNRDDSAFCKACGRPLARTAEPPAAVIKRWLRRRAAVVLTALLTVALAVALLTVKAGPRINMDRYLVIDQSGYDGYGTVSVRIDWEAIKDKYGSRLKLTRQAKKAKKALGILGDMFSPMTLMKLYISVETDADSMMSNGESVGYSWSYDEKLTDYVKCRIKCKDGRLKVKDLKRVRGFDPFDDILVEFSGLSSEGTADFQYSGSELSRFDFSFDKEAGLKNGDRVTLKLDLSDSALRNMAKTQGKAPKQLTKKYTVSGLRELEKWDPFDYITLSFSGLEPHGEVRIELKEELPEFWDKLQATLECYQSGHLSNGDEFTVYFKTSGGHDAAEHSFSAIPY